MHSTNNAYGFTLIELLVVIAIISLLSSVVLASLSGAREGARNTRRATDFNQFRTAVQAYKSDTGSWPGGGDSQGVRVASECSSTNIYTDLVDGGYLQQMPTDPQDSMSTCQNSSNNLDNVENSEEYFYIWDSSNAGGNYCFGINEFEGTSNATNLEDLNQASQGDMGNNGNLAYAEFVYCFQDQ